MTLSTKQVILQITALRKRLFAEQFSRNLKQSLAKTGQVTAKGVLRKRRPSLAKAQRFFARGRGKDLQRTVKKQSETFLRRFPQ